jgi:High potential iron-sulfur protein
MTDSKTVSTRRVFLIQVAACGTALTAATGAVAQAKVDVKDAQAAALGYVEDTTKADAKKFTKHSKDQKCTNCALYQGKATDAYGGCPLFGTKQVAGPGWCSAWAKKA